MVFYNGVYTWLKRIKHNSNPDFNELSQRLASPGVRCDADQPVNRVLKIDLCQERDTQVIKTSYMKLHKRYHFWYYVNELLCCADLSMSLSCVLPAHRSEPADKTTILSDPTQQ